MNSDDFSLGKYINNILIKYQDGKMVFIIITVINV